jgi:CRP-like cAMP-binding protein
VRRHVPGTLAGVPCAATVTALIEALGDLDPMLRFKALAALHRVHGERPDLEIPRAPVETALLAETRRHARAVTLHAALSAAAWIGQDTLLLQTLQERQGRSRHRVFRLLGLLHPQADITAVRMAVDDGDERARASAVEYLDSLLTGEVRRRVLAVIEGIPVRPRIEDPHPVSRTGAAPEQSLVRLIHNEDEVLAALAIHAAAERGVRGVDAELRDVLAHRAGDRWSVADAASWALSGRSGEPLPAVELVHRMRCIPLFRDVPIDDLFHVAAGGRQVRYEAGQVMLRAGAHPEALHLLIDGTVLIDSSAEGRTAPAALDLEEMLDRTPLSATIRADAAAVVLALTREEFFALLSGSVGLVHGMFRTLFPAHSGDTAPHLLRATLPPEFGPGQPAPLQLIDRVLVLEGHPLLRGASGDQLLRLAAVAREVRLEAGTSLFDGTSNPAVDVLLDGEVDVEPTSGAPYTVGRGDTAGAYEVLAGVPPDARAAIRQSGRAVRIDGGDLLDVLMEDTELLQRVFSAGRRLWAAPTAAAASAAPAAASLPQSHATEPVGDAPGGLPTEVARIA